MPQDNLELETNPCLKMLEFWIEYKQMAVEENDYSSYGKVLRMSLQELNKVYAKGEKEWFLDMVGQMIKLASHELRAITLESKKEEIPF